MRALTILSVLLVGASQVHAQAEAIEWIQLAGGSSYDFGFAVAADNHGNSIIAGATRSSMSGENTGRYDLFVAKYDSAGKRLWLNQRGSDQREFAYGVATDADGHIYVTGYTGHRLDENTPMGMWDIFLMKFDPAGKWLWTRQEGSNRDDEGRAVTTDSSGNVYVAGVVRGNLHAVKRTGSADAFVCKYNSAGARLWTALWGSSEVDEAFGIACDSSENVFVTGWCGGSIEDHPYGGNGDAFLVKYDTHGKRQWLKQWGTENKETGYALACDRTGNVYASGYTTGELYGPRNGNRDIFLAKFDPSGKLLWGRQSGTAEHDQAWGLATDAEGNAYVTGETGASLHGSQHAGGSDLFLSKYDRDGARRWTQQSGTEGIDWARGVALGGNGVAFLTGASTGKLGGIANQGLDDAFLMKVATHRIPARARTAPASR